MSLSETTSRGAELDRWFAAYSADHQHPTNQLLHLFCVPAIVWSILALLLLVPLPASVPAGLLAWLLGGMAVTFWLRLSRALGAMMLALMVVVLAATSTAIVTIGATAMLWIAIAVFVIAWIGQFIGHHYEGKRPSFFTDLVYLLIGPLWVLAKLVQRRSGL
jgi:uncharacterized membrane protein YGL010W